MLQRISDVQTVIIKAILIAVGTFAIIYIAISVYGNIALNTAAQGPKQPSIAKAEWEFTVQTTGQSFLSDDYVNPEPGVYILNEYYELKGDKWALKESSLPLNEYYWGPISVNRRVK